jgi:hypothetical protein
VVLVGELGVVLVGELGVVLVGEWAWCCGLVWLI